MSVPFSERRAGSRFPWHSAARRAALRAALRAARRVLRRYWPVVLLALALFLAAMVVLLRERGWRRQLLPVTALFIRPAAHVAPAAEADLGDIGRFPRWGKIEIGLAGPATAVDAPDNPFAITVDVTFTGPDGRTFVVPAFYDGDGAGGYAGDVWKVRFAADAPGRWQFRSASSHPLLGGYYGRFTVDEPAGCAPYEPGGLPDFACVGRLEARPGQHYLGFAAGGDWIKGGIDDPENFLGDAFGGWAAKRAAIDLLRDHGSNSIYLMTNNITPGDRNDTWPWLGATPAEAKRQTDRFDVVRLAEWEAFFSYVQAQGIVLHLVLDDDSAWYGYDHYLYYREMVARFGHHLGLIWNIGEEADENYWDSEQLRLAGLLRQLDPYGHPVTVHRKSPWPFLGRPEFDLTSIQPQDGASDFTTAELHDYNRLVIDHRERSVTAGRPIPIMIDETPRVRQVTAATRFKLRSQVLYPIYLAGGNFELHYHDAYGQGGALRLEEMTPMLAEMAHARRFVELLPLAAAAPCSGQLLPAGTPHFCLGQAGRAYGLYAPAGGTLQLDLAPFAGQAAALRWFNPRTGELGAAIRLAGDQPVRVTPPFDGDAALLLTVVEAATATTEKVGCHSR